MQKTILLIDTSITVKKVISLSIDQKEYDLKVATHHDDAIHMLRSFKPFLMFVSDQLDDIDAGIFPKEVESYCSEFEFQPQLILITTRDIQEQRGYDSLLKKPFTPSYLQKLVSQHLNTFQNQEAQIIPPKEKQLPQEKDVWWEGETSDQSVEVETDIDHLIAISQNAKSQSSSLESTQLQENLEVTPQSVSHESNGLKPLWGDNKSSNSQVRPDPLSHESIASTSKHKPEPTVPTVSEEMTGASLTQRQDEMDKLVELTEKRLDKVIKEVLHELVPPIVERMVQEKLDNLFNDSQDPSVKYKSGS